MTVKELIAQLTNLDQELKVLMEDTDEFLLEIQDIHVWYFEINSRVILSCLSRK
ncbi:hypothetical protein F2Y95_24865 [Aphanizomenon flos-aquae CCAP 1446/1C]|uniref:Uncharacterized protein n=1 Tax=Anabaena cylindrica (strain ATCC 27899 / PCC 7122) TaxID=272123 RepID=K9ZE80_ANACC|nr:hypothetical protein Anacy_1391 [Anabaena cylindrica PCC 7122]MBY5284889.1 hypothetical protein [Anabaena sp. CCAP 1446/1C]BAY06141.1 hypothetical protein NIES19_54240 [Anabaena cylindrica PCC 7122]